MNTVFIGGSRQVSRLPQEVRERLDKVAANGHQVVVGDANGADKAVQKHFADARYRQVTVFCSGATPRNNVGAWPVQQIEPPRGARGFQLHAAKDREMARRADFGFMIWDGKSAGTVLNVLRLLRAGKVSVLFDTTRKAALNLRSMEQWASFLAQCPEALRADLEERATPEEWTGDAADRQPSLLDRLASPVPDHPAPPEAAGTGEAVAALNDALASGDAGRALEVLGGLARDRGMSQVARESGLARESLYRSLGVGGNPEFATVLKVLSSIGLRLEAQPKGDPGSTSRA